MLRIRWTRPALLDFIAAQERIAEESPVAARQVAFRIYEATRMLREYPYIGRLGHDEDTREWLVQRTPYLLVYELRDDMIEITRLWHTSQNRPEAS